MLLFVNILIAISLLAVVVILGLGFYSLNRGGAFGEKWSNRFMQYRVLAQFIAIGLLVIGLALKATGKY